MKKYEIDTDDASATIRRITNNIEKFENPEEFMEIEDKELRAKLLPDWKMTVARELEFQLTTLKFVVGQRFDELPAFERALREVTKYIDNTEKDSKKVEA